MSILLEIREHIQKLYHKYAPGFNVLFRFLAAFITFFATNKVIGFNPYLNPITLFVAKKVINAAKNLKRTLKPGAYL